MRSSAEFGWKPFGFQLKFSRISDDFGRNRIETDSSSVKFSWISDVSAEVQQNFSNFQPIIFFKKFRRNFSWISAESAEIRLKFGRKKAHRNSYNLQNNYCLNAFKLNLSTSFKTAGRVIRTKWFEVKKKATTDESKLNFLCQPIHAGLKFFLS